MLRRHTRLCREGWFYLAVVVVVFGGAMAKEVNLLLILAGMMLGPVLINWHAVGANIRGLRIDRRLPRGICAGELLSVTLSASNVRQRLGCWAVVVEEEIRRIGGAESQTRPAPLHPRVLFPHIPANESRSGSYRGRLLERGRYEFGPLRLSTRFPFGLFANTQAVGPIETLVVVPRLGRLTDRWTARRLDAFSGADRRRRRPGAEGDFYGVREWRAGDGRRLVHWRRSARLGKLVVRQFERPQNRDLAVVLDLWRPQRSGIEHADDIELAVSFAATVLDELCRVGGCQASLSVGNGSIECLGGPASPGLLQQLMERLALVEPRTDDLLPAQLEQALRQIDAGTEIVLVSTRPVDLSDASRFEMLWSDPMLRERVRHVRCIDTSNETLREFFEPL